MAQSTAPTAVSTTDLSGVTLWRRGKVRDVYALDGHLLVVATDRISAFDVVLPTPVPDKGAVLTQLSRYWFDLLDDVIPNHLVSTDPAEYPEVLRPHTDLLAGRSMLCLRTTPLPVECVVRGWITGSGWKDYQKTGSVCGIELPKGLRESERLSEPLFTPSTKEESGHDVNISYAQLVDRVGREQAEHLRDASLEIYERARVHAEQRGILLADTKFEFGTREGRLVWIDEALTPDSSRFWPADGYAPGRSQPPLSAETSAASPSPLP